jgi:hypothetical protein|tara:strand:- start:175 stop:549 length:375 start_codon:yes stop_codon:yes gene_type:complete
MPKPNATSVTADELRAAISAGSSTLVMSGYVDFRGNLTTNRSVVLDPAVGGQVVDGHKGSYVVGWDVARKDIRMFLLDAIGEAVIRKTTAAEKAELPQLTARMLERLTNAKVRMVNRPPQPQAA